MLIPSIDLMNGKAVQLRQGKEKVLERENVLELAKYFAQFGEIAVIDLDAAFNQGDNEALIQEICKIAPARVGGGIRDVEKAKRMLALGAKKIIIGTAANEEFLSKLPKDKVLVAIDEKNGKIAVDGWQNENEFSPLDYIKRFDNLCSGYLYTVVENEGMMQGCNFEKIKKVREATKLDVIAAGGISTLDEIKTLEKMNVSSQLGMAIYTDAIKLEDAFINNLDFDKQDGLIPTIVQDYDSKQVLMLAYSTPDSLKMTFEKGLATYYSRSRKELWTKGETSGNVQELMQARYDCDFDTILFKVKQKGNACHLGRYSCFEDKEFAICQLYELLLDRKKNLPENSFTTKLFKNEFYLKRKLMEEAFEVVNFEQGDGLGWEASDLIYFLLTFMAKHDITPRDILNNLASRTK